MDASVLVGRVVTMTERGAIDDGAVAIEHGLIAFVGARSEVPERFAPLTPRRAGLITPGLVDAHTHAAWVGSRHDEYLAKLRGEGYETIAARGGGIVASMRAIEESDVATIADTLVARLRRMAALGVTTVEVKSGYGLRPELERRQLEAIAEASMAAGVPRVIATFLALHALPPEARGDDAKRAPYVEGQIELVREVATNKHARFVDAYVDRNAFRIDEARALMTVAREVGLGVRMHIGQFADIGGAELAGELSARSADHLENVGEAGLAALAAGNVAAVLLPIASFVLGQSPPDVAALRRAGLRLVVASDSNPGTAPSESLPLAMSFAARLYGLSTDEVLAGVTCHAARSLDLDGGVVREGAAADVVGWDLPHEEALLQPWGTTRATFVLRDGKPIG
jgi:imidazolonepropionase